MTARESRLVPWGSHACALAAYLAVAILFSWPLPAHLATHLTGTPDGDTGVYIWNMWVFQHEILDQRSLPYFTGRIFSGTGGANLGLHNFTPFASALGLPLVQLMGVVAAFNVVYLALVVLTAYGMFLLARQVTGDSATAWLAGVLFAWSPVLATRSLGHFSLVAAAPLPIFVLALLRTRDRHTWREALWLGATVAWATACDVYYGVFCVILAAAFLVAPILRLTRAQPSRSWAPVTRALDVVIACLAGLILALAAGRGWEFTLVGRLVRIRTLYTPVLLLTLLTMVRIGVHYRLAIRPAFVHVLTERFKVLAAASLVAVVLLSPLLYAFARVVADGWIGIDIFWRSSPPGIDLVALVVPNPNHPLAPAALREWIAQLTRDGYLENVASIPLVALAAMLAAWRVGWRPLPLYSTLALGFGALALGPFLQIGGVLTYVPGPWAVLRYVPVVGLARSPGRFVIFAMVGVAVLFAAALGALLARWPGARRPLLAGVALLLMAELLPAPRTLHSAEVPAIYRTIAEDPRDDIRVLELPFGYRDGTMSAGNFTARTQYYQTAHGKPILGGYLSRVSRRRVRDAERQPVLSALMRLSEGLPLADGASTVVVERWPAFAERMRIGYIVVDGDRIPEGLRDLVRTLPLEKVAADGPFTLYRPAPSRAAKPRP